MLDPVRLRLLYPDLHPIVAELEPDEAVEALRDGRCDMAITYTYNVIPQEPLPGLLLEPLGVEPVLLALPSAHQAAAGQDVDLRLLEGEEWIAGSRGSADHELTERACALAGFVPRVTHTADDYDLILRMVAHGLGTALVPEAAAGYGVPPEVRLLSIMTAHLTRHIQVLTRRATTNTRAIRALITLLS
jgi:DNA-binding transcriptional LysR family regulator